LPALSARLSDALFEAPLEICKGSETVSNLGQAKKRCRRKVDLALIQKDKSGICRKRRIDTQNREENTKNREKVENDVIKGLEIKVARHGLARNYHIT
jgi:hypothetical protein